MVHIYHTWGGVFRAEGTGAERGANWCTEWEGQAGRLAFRGGAEAGNFMRARRLKGG